MKQNRKGFTLAELLIVVAIIAVLVAVAIPVFSAQLEKSREATDVANIRSAYSEVVTKYLEKPTQSNRPTISVTAQQRQQGCQTSPAPYLTYQGNGQQVQKSLKSIIGAGSLPTKYTVTISIAGDGTATPKITAG
ncbi:MAG: prepilin-type N-terminal cleavage/methylation domain-containing protein [Oscillospiraceae bacterium]|jgi:type IV pilus assembly protein PilA|nr:prepilin-type N-terminal cleavage/methylation domain-containing protein [Oscillospiraceae bacterium]